MLIHLKGDKVIAVNKEITKEDAAPYVASGAVWKDSAPAAISDFLAGSKDAKYNGSSFVAVEIVPEIIQKSIEETMLELLQKIAAKIGA